MSMNESQRQSYLETMGIQSYFPRYILSDAKESVLCQWPQEIELAEVGEVEPSLPRSPQKAAQDSPPVSRSPASNKARPSLVINRVVKDRSAESSPATAMKRELEAPVVKNSEPENIESEKKAADTVSDRNNTPAQLIRFQLAYIRVNESISVLNQIPTLGSNRLSRSHQTLLLNMLKSLQHNTDHIQFDDMPFRWPMIEGKHIDNSQAAARKTLHSFLDQKQADAKFSVLWVMGDMAADLVDREQCPWQVVCTKSLDEILNFPQLKRDVWRQLRKLPLASSS